MVQHFGMVRMKKLILLLLVISFSGCVSVTTGLQLAEFGVKVGFDIHNYVADKKAEAKEMSDANRSE